MNNLINEDKKYIVGTYGRVPVEIEKGKGVYVWDKYGKKYFDTYSGIAVTSLGHGNPQVLEAAKKQMDKYIHLSNYFASEPVVELAKKLVENTFAKKVFFSNTGTESNEAAMKISRKYGKSISEDKTVILSANNSFHGRTYGSVSITGQAKYQESFKPLLPDVDMFDYNDIEDFKNKVSDRVCAVFLEPVQGEGGILELEKDFILEVKALSEKYNFLLVMDEIQSGMGRTGTFLAIEQYGIKPDIVTMSKALGGGFPVGAVLTGEKCCDILEPGDHGTTFGPNPVACAAANVIVTEILKKSFLDAVIKKGEYIKGKARKLRERYPETIKSKRGRVLIIGIDTGTYALPIKNAGLEKGVLINVTAGSIVRLIPALTITFEEIDEMMDLFENTIKAIDKQ